MKRLFSAFLVFCICLSAGIAFPSAVRAKASLFNFGGGETRTSTESTQIANWNALVSGKEVNGRQFPEFSEGILGSVVVPGLTETHELDAENKSFSCNCMAPQGVCFAEGYMLIAAYCTEDKSAHSSVLYILKDGKYIETLVLIKEDGSPFVNHMGGLVYLDGVLYLPGNSDKCVYQIPADALFSGFGKKDARKVTVSKAFSTGRTTSFIGEYGGMLYVGTFYHDETQNQSTTLYGYDPSTGKHSKTDEIILPLLKVQGIVFLERADGVYILISASYNRNTPSWLVSFKWDGERELPTKKIYDRFRMPNMSEDLCLSGSDAWILFESASKKYLEGEVLRPLDRVVCYDTDRITFDLHANGVVKGPDCEWGMYRDGLLDQNYSGVAKNEFGWWRVERGRVNFSANGIYKNAYGWWKTTNGKVTFKENGVFKNAYGWWKVEKSKVDFKFTGIASNKYGTWYIENGKVDFKKNGKVKYKGQTYEIKDGKAKT